MKFFRISLYCLVSVFLLTGELLSADLTERRPTARAWLVVDELTGAQVRFNRTTERRPIASTTKLLTALAIVEIGDLDEWVRVSANAAGQQPSKMGIKQGEHWRRKDLLKALLMQSANDAATALAESARGSEAKFCNFLTQRARKLGCSNTRIGKASGLPAKGQGSTAQDLAILTRQAVRNSSILAILKTSAARIESREGRVIHLKNKNRLHDSSKGVLLGKTGYTRGAGRCFGGMMTLEGRSYTIVLLGSKDLWHDLKLLRSWTRNFSRALNKNRRDLNSQKILIWQKKLSQGGLNPGPLDGVWGARTQIAFLRWQQKRMKAPHGQVS